MPEITLCVAKLDEDGEEEEEEEEKEEVDAGEG